MGRGRGESDHLAEVEAIERVGIDDRADLLSQFNEVTAIRLKNAVRQATNSKDAAALIGFFQRHRWLLDETDRPEVEAAITQIAELSRGDSSQLSLQSTSSRFLSCCGATPTTLPELVAPRRGAKAVVLLHISDTGIETLCGEGIDRSGGWQLAHQALDWNGERPVNQVVRCAQCTTVALQSADRLPFRIDSQGKLTTLSESETKQLEEAIAALPTAEIIARGKEDARGIVRNLRPLAIAAIHSTLAEIASERFLAKDGWERFDSILPRSGLAHENELRETVLRVYGEQAYEQKWPSKESLCEQLTQTMSVERSIGSSDQPNRTRFVARLIAEIWPQAVQPLVEQTLGDSSWVRPKELLRTWQDVAPLAVAQASVAISNRQ